MSDLFIEVDEAMKQEKLQKLWNDYGSALITFIAALIIGTAGNAGYKAWQKETNITQTNLYFEATEQTSAEIIEKSQTLKNPFLKTALQLHAAGKAAQNNETEKLSEILSTITQDDQADPTLQKIAQLINISNTTSLSADEKLNQLKTIYNDPAHPWQYYAHLEAALINANAVQNYTAARQHLKQITDNQTLPDTLRKKAQSLDILYTLKSKK